MVQRRLTTKKCSTQFQPGDRVIVIRNTEKYHEFWSGESGTIDRARREHAWVKMDRDPPAGEPTLLLLRFLKKETE